MKVALIAPQIRVEDSLSPLLRNISSENPGANTGNFAFVHALWSHLSPHVEIFPWEASPRIDARAMRHHRHGLRKSAWARIRTWSSLR